MKNTFWKALGVLLLLYVFSMTLLVPLGPGLLEFQDKGKVQHSDIVGRSLPVYEVIGFGTHWDENSDSLGIFVKSKGQLAALEIFEITDETHALVGLDLPYSIPSKSWNVLVNHPIDGTLLLENALFLSDRFVDASIELPTPAVQEFGSNLPFHFPYQPQIVETIRNLMLHVPLWFTMFLLMGIGFVASIGQLSNNRNMEADMRAFASVRVGMWFGVLGLATGSFWARFTWGAWWVDDPQLNGALVTVLVYAGYLVLRNAVDDERLRARLAAVYNLFAFVILVILLMVLPRFSESLHPGKGGNPGFNSYDLDDALRMVFYPAVIGWMLLGTWMYLLTLRMTRINRKLDLLP
ncbi:MAG: cytochrome c biogenesis protein CcsA [Flavobacteriales bacterium]|nr:cytochrome c biogenesis protein CcsA [Flavobacteriales bacterium]